MSHHNQDRILTLAVQIKEPGAAEELWNCFGEGKLLAGCQINAIGNGNKFKAYDELNELLGEVYEYLQKNHLGDADAESLLDKIDSFDKIPQ